MIDKTRQPTRHPAEAPPTVIDALDQLRRGATSSFDLVERCLEAGEAPHGEGGRVFIKLHSDQARKEALACDRQRASVRERGPLSGIPISIKDLFDVSGEVTLAGSKVLSNALAAAADSDVVRNLKSAGAVVIGRTNMSEFAFSAVGLNPHYGTPGNPWDRSRTPGGSSSGAAVSVADGMAAAAVGSDTGGSIRVPAALCGLVGFKPTASRVSTRGALPLSTTLDSIGPIARSVADCILVDSILTGQPPSYLTTRNICGLKLVMPQNVVLDDLCPEVASTFERAVSLLSALGARLTTSPFAELREIPSLNAQWGGFPPIEAFAWHEQLLDSGGADYDPRARARFEQGRNRKASEYIRLQRARIGLIQRCAEPFRDTDALVLPTCPVLAPFIARLESDDAHFWQMNALLSRNSALFNFLDCCAVTIPIQRIGDLPVGLMLVGKNGTDSRLLQTAQAIEYALEPSRH